MYLNNVPMQAEEFLRHPDSNNYRTAIQLLSEVLVVVDTKNEVIRQQEIEIENLYRKLEGQERLV